MVKYYETPMVGRGRMVAELAILVSNSLCRLFVDHEVLRRCQPKTRFPGHWLFLVVSKAQLVAQDAIYIFHFLDQRAFLSLIEACHFPRPDLAQPREVLRQAVEEGRRFPVRLQKVTHELRVGWNSNHCPKALVVQPQVWNAHEDKTTSREENAV